MLYSPSEAAAAEKAAEDQEAASEKAKPASNSSVRQASTNRGARRVQKPNYQEQSSTGRAISFVFILIFELRAPFTDIAFEKLQRNHGRRQECRFDRFKDIFCCCKHTEIV